MLKDSCPLMSMSFSQQSSDWWFKYWFEVSDDNWWQDMKRKRSYEKLFFELTINNIFSSDRTLNHEYIWPYKTFSRWQLTMTIQHTHYFNEYIFKNNFYFSCLNFNYFVKLCRDLHIWSICNIVHLYNVFHAYSSNKLKFKICLWLMIQLNIHIIIDTWIQFWKLMRKSHCIENYHV